MVMQAWGIRLYALILAIVGLVLTIGGFQLARLGGSLYYLPAGLALVASALLLFRKRREGAIIYLIVLFMTIVWAVWEAGLNGWLLMPRLVAPLALGLVLLIPGFTRALAGPRLIGLPLTALIALGSVLLGVGLHQLNPSPADPIYRAGITEPSNGGQEMQAFGDGTGDWEVWGKNQGGSRFSPLDEITPDNVANLEVAWTYRVGADPDGNMRRLSVTPLKIDSTIFLCNNWNDVIALDAETGKQKWRSASNARIDPFGSCRGVAYYEVPDGVGHCAKRIITATVDSRLIAVDAADGKRCAAFGVDGAVSLLKGMGEVRRSYYLVDSAPVIVRGNIVIGGRVIDNQYWGEPSGVIRAFDAVTGRFSWAFDVGRLDYQGEPGDGEVYTHSTPNSWAPMSADEQLGLIYAPLGNATNDYYSGRRRPFDNRFSSSTVAIDAETGKLRWSFQTLRKDVWDFDVPAQPTLVDFPAPDGTMQRALVQPTKRGEIFVLDRATGKPIHKVIDQQAPTNGQAPGEKLSPTQPYAVGMPSLAGPKLRESDMWGISPLDQMWCRIEYRKSRYEGPLTPPGLTTSIQYPGPAGGINWGSVTVDTDRNILVANGTRMASRVRLLDREEANRQGLEPFDPEGTKKFAGAGPQEGAPYAVDMKWFFSPLQIPCISPPFGIIAGIDLTSGKLIWSKPLGTADNSGPFGKSLPLPITVGVPSTGGPMTTRSGLTFIAATQESHFRAFDTRTGKLLWDTKLPAGGHAIPMTYKSPESGRQFVVVAASGFSALRSKEGDYIVAYALPEK